MKIKKLLKIRLKHLNDIKNLQINTIYYHNIDLVLFMRRVKKLLVIIRQQLNAIQELQFRGTHYHNFILEPYMSKDTMIIYQKKVLILQDIILKMHLIYS